MAKRTLQSVAIAVLATAVSAGPPLFGCSLLAAEEPVGPPAGRPTNLPDLRSPRSVELPAVWLEGIKDLTRGISDTEREPYYSILALSRDLELPALRAAARTTAEDAERAFRADPRNDRRKFSQFFDIVQHPDRYRGKPVTLHGYIQRLETIEAGENDEGLKTLHQAYLFTGDSAQNPYVVVCTAVPPGIPHPTRGNPTNDIYVTGYFFKLWAYDAERGHWVAPLILAKELEWHPRPVPLSARSGFKVAVVVGLTGVLAAIVVVLLRQQTGDRRLRAARDVRARAQAEQELATLEQTEQEQ